VAKARLENLPHLSLAPIENDRCHFRKSHPDILVVWADQDANSGDPTEPFGPSVANKVLSNSAVDKAAVKYQAYFPDDVFGRDRSATNIPSACRIANIAFNDAMILSYDANLGRMEFSERTGHRLFKAHQFFAF
jgi:hypothetical protein